MYIYQQLSGFLFGVPPGTGAGAQTGGGITAFQHQITTRKPMKNRHKTGEISLKKTRQSQQAEDRLQQND